RHAYREVLRPVGRAVLHPFTLVCDDSLTSPHDDLAAGMLHAQHAVENIRVLVKLRRLPRFNPAGRTSHVRDAHGTGLGVHAPNDFVDELRFVTGRGDAGWLGNDCGHVSILLFYIPQFLGHGPRVSDPFGVTIGKHVIRPAMMPDVIEDVVLIAFR